MAERKRISRVDVSVAGGVGVAGDGGGGVLAELAQPDTRLAPAGAVRPGVEAGAQERAVLAPRCSAAAPAPRPTRAEGARTQHARVPRCVGEAVGAASVMRRCVMAWTKHLRSCSIHTRREHLSVCTDADPAAVTGSHRRRRAAGAAPATSASPGGAVCGDPNSDDEIERDQRLLLAAVGLQDLCAFSVYLCACSLSVDLKDKGKMGIVKKWRNSKLS